MDPVAICNLALGFIGANRITTLVAADAASTEEELCAAMFGPLVKKLLGEKAWLFATGLIDLGAIVAAPAGEVNRVDLPSRFLLPSTAIVVRGCDDGSGDFEIKWERSGQYVVSEETTALYAIVTQYVEDSALWDPTFCFAVAYHLASDLVVPLVGEKAVGLQRTMYAQYERELRKAAIYDGMQGSTNEVAQVKSSSLSRRR